MHKPILKSSRRCLTVLLFFFLIAALSLALLCRQSFQPVTLPDPTVQPNAAPIQNNETLHILHPNAEVRGVYIASISNLNFPSKKGLSAAQLQAELDEILKTCENAKLNTIYFQVHPSADSLHVSKIFPVSAVLSGTQCWELPDGFDPLAYLIAQAHSRNIRVHAWVNPLRITTGSASAPQHDLTALAEGHPAREHPDWAVPYADGKLYFDVGIPEVRTLIAESVREIVKNYAVDGVLFDDYFYPYPVGKEVFDDAASYEHYGNGKKKEDWRRENVNTLVELCFQTIKEIRESCQFGIAPFGIWKNSSSDPSGSETAGMEAFHAIYCDALAWIQGEYIDYIAPQIYWQFSTSAAKYDTLVRWWNSQLEGTKVRLLISHAAYRSEEWKSNNEMIRQIGFARSELSYIGSIFYGYTSIRADEQELISQLQTLYSEEIIYTDIVSDPKELCISSPASGSHLSESATFLLGQSDPAYPVYLNGTKIGRTKSGFFSLYVSLNPGKNEFVLSQCGKEWVYTLYRDTAQANPVQYEQLSSFEVLRLSHQGEVILREGDSLHVTAVAPSGSKVTLRLGNLSIAMTQKSNPPKQGPYMAATYEGTLTMPALPDGENAQALGSLTVSAQRGKKQASASGASVTVYSPQKPLLIEVTQEAAELKKARNSWYYDDYTPAAIGMRDHAVHLQNGYYKLRMGGYIKADHVKVLDETASVPFAKITHASVQTQGISALGGGKTIVTISCEEHPPVDGRIESGIFYLTIYSTAESDANPVMEQNPLFSDAALIKSAAEHTLRYAFTLRNPFNFYGFSVCYRQDEITISFRNPEVLPNTSLPLAGKTIVLDAGHGGSDPGALAPGSEINEKSLNLAIVLAAAENLRALGAEVLLTREEDVAVTIPERLTMLLQTKPDFCLSIHQNSMPYSSDIRTTGGLLGLYYADAGRLLAETVSASTADTLWRLCRPTTKQRLAMVRNPEFPAALIEIGFITSVEEYERCCTAYGQKQAAQGITDGILAYYEAQRTYLLS